MFPGQARAVGIAVRARSDFEYLFDSIDDMAIVVDSRFRVLRANETARSWLRIRSDETPVGRLCYAAFHGRDAPCPDCPVADAFATGEPVRVEKFSEGLGRFLSVSASPVSAPDSRVTQVIEIARDVTRQKGIERELAHYREHLEEVVEERTSALHAAQDELLQREKLAVLGQIAGSVAHELRNPLGTIRNAVYLLNMTVGRDLPDQAARHLALIDDEIDRSNRIITSLLDFARGRPCNPVACGLKDILVDALDMACLSNRIDVTFDVPDDLPLAYVDDAQVLQVFLNIMVNARQAMEDGGELVVSAAAEDDVLRVRVGDSGPGMEPEVLARLFEPLFSTKSFGVGLGLAISRSFVQANGGSLAVASAPGDGTVFTITLPTTARDEPGS